MDIHTILQRLEENEALARKFHEIETSILTIFNYQDLFKELLDQIQLKFGVPLVWLFIIKDSEVSRLAERLLPLKPCLSSCGLSFLTGL